MQCVYVCIYMFHLSNIVLRSMMTLALKSKVSAVVITVVLPVWFCGY